MHNSLLLRCSLFSLLLLTACSSSESDGGPGGASDAGAGGSTGSGGAQASGGAPASGGAGAEAGACTPVASVEEAVRVYGEAWNDKDAESRACKLRRSMTDDATYVDPTVDTTTSAALADAIGAFQTTFPAGAIEEITGLDARDGELRFGWDFLNNGASFVKGEDYMEIAADGRISAVRGYWEPYPAAAPHAALDAYVVALSEADGTAREASLEAAVSATVRFTAPGSIDVTGITALSAAIGDAGVTSVAVTGTQIYPKYLRVALTLTLGDAGTESVTDYAYVGPDGKLTRLARFEGELPPLP